MLYLAPAIGLAAGGAFTAYDWWWVGLLAGRASSRELGSGSDGSSVAGNPGGDLRQPSVVGTTSGPMGSSLR